MRLNHDARRCGAVLLALMVVGLAYWLTIHAWFVAPLLRMAQEEGQMMIDHQRYARLEAQRETYKVRLEAASDSPMIAGTPLSAAGPEAAQAQVMQLVVERSAMNPESGLPCIVLNRIPRQVSEQGGLTKVVIEVALECGPQALATTLHRLEHQVPLLLIESMDIRRLDEMSPDNGHSPNRLAVQLQLSGYLARKQGARHE
ncbi:type II secretion system protein GspM [Pseudomonas huaxiensis]|uniref:type II secretion system protein GspM n=1 Tax=Pseudomonas huaxiensis TaxID=2213017 RepID=UPI000DA68DDC|nr:type II secretion system protein GspM [Pseudomonas huaxiensis]